MRTRGLFIQSTGVHIADRISVAEAVAAGWYDQDEAEATGYVGIAVAGDVSAPELALAASRRALDRLAEPAVPLSHLFYADVYHSGPDGWLPYTYLQRHLSADDAFGTGVRQGCNGMFGALRLADAALRTTPAGPDGEAPAVLLVAADNFGSPLLDRWTCNPGLVMADGAAALVLGRTPGVAEVLSVAAVNLSGLEALHRGDTPLAPPDLLLGRPLDFGARFAEFARSGGFGPGSGLEFVERFGGLVDRLLDEAGIGLDEVTRVAFNHAGRETVEDRVVGPLGVPLKETTWEYGSTIGHVGAADQVIALDHLLDTGELGPGCHLLLLGVGPGVTIAGAVIKVLDVPHWLSKPAGPS
ncbi:ketoacyl-ACP synthase III family protein [Spirillospora sp. NBC_00431]